MFYWHFSQPGTINPHRSSNHTIDYHITPKTLKKIQKKIANTLSCWHFLQPRTFELEIEALSTKKYAIHYYTFIGFILFYGKVSLHLATISSVRLHDHSTHSKRYRGAMTLILISQKIIFFSIICIVSTNLFTETVNSSASDQAIASFMVFQLSSVEFFHSAAINCDESAFWGLRTILWPFPVTFFHAISDSEGPTKYRNRDEKILHHSVDLFLFFFS